MAKSNEKSAASAKPSRVLPWDASEPGSGARAVATSAAPDECDHTSETAVAYILGEDAPAALFANAADDVPTDERAILESGPGERTEPIRVDLAALGDSPARPAPAAGARSAPQASKDEPEPPELAKGFEDRRGASADPGARLRLVLVLGASLLVIGGVAVFGAVAFLSGERPDKAELQLAYPYGFEGLRGPRGEQAPGAAALVFHFLEEVPCVSHRTCLRYRYSAGDFTGTMVVGKAGDGSWVRVGDEGMPFVPMADEP